MSSSLGVVGELRMVLLASCLANKNIKAFVMDSQHIKANNVVSIYNSPPQISNVSVFLSCTLCMISFLNTLFLYIYFFSCFKEGNGVEQKVASRFSVLS